MAMIPTAPLRVRTAATVVCIRRGEANAVLGMEAECGGGAIWADRASGCIWRGRSFGVRPCGPMDRWTNGFNGAYIYIYICIHMYIYIHIYIYMQGASHTLQCQGPKHGKSRYEASSNMIKGGDFWHGAPQQRANEPSLAW